MCVFSLCVHILYNWYFLQAFRCVCTYVLLGVNVYVCLVLYVYACLCGGVHH